MNKGSLLSCSLVTCNHTNTELLLYFGILCLRLGLKEARQAQDQVFQCEYMKLQCLLLPGVSLACHDSPYTSYPSNYPLSTPYPQSIHAFPSAVLSISHECLVCSVHTKQRPNPSGIHYMGTTSAASSSLQLLSSIGGVMLYRLSLSINQV